MNYTELAVVMPVYNEQGAIATVIEKWMKELTRLKVAFLLHAYNDGSRDGTLPVLLDLKKHYPNLIVHDKPNSGHGPTILRAYKENAAVPWIFQMDSDDEMGPEGFESLWIQRNNFDFLLGKRMGRNQPLERRILSAFSRCLVRLLYGAQVYDVNAPYRLMRTSAFRHFFYLIPASTFAPNIILSGACSLRSLRVHETPVAHRQRETGQVSINRWKTAQVAVRSCLETILFRFRVSLGAGAEEK
jgi:glycosyltransferase involved in cell wall biosynthesis